MEYKIIPNTSRQNIVSKNKPKYLPKRLINVYSHELIDSKNIDNEQYAIISHVWSQELKIYNENSIKSKVILASEYCKYLSINWLWIDNLCIYQDEDEKSIKDKEEQIPLMSEYYKNAEVCIIMNGIIEFGHYKRHYFLKIYIV